MAGNKRSRTRNLSALTLKDNEGICNRADDTPTSFDLPTHVLELIFSQLNLRDIIRASAVCKKWLDVTVSVLEPNKVPLLMRFPNSGALYEFYDPSNRKRYDVEFPELIGARICHSKGGWLLVYGHCLFFFHPYTRQLINLPKRCLQEPTAAFSAVPTSSSCIVFTVCTIHWRTLVSTCRPGATEWTTKSFHNPWNLPFIGTCWDKIIFCAGLFYCLTDFGWLGVYDTDAEIWRFSSLCPPYFTGISPRSDWQRGKFMIEHDGDVYVIYTSPKQRPVIYKVDKVGKEWSEIGSLGRLTFFVNSLSSIARSDFLGKMRSSIYFSRVQLHGKKCVYYSPDAGRYYPGDQIYDWGKQDSGKSIWIDAPEDLSVFSQRWQKN